jgi:rhodanese-related sulfurtransferase
MAIQAFTPGDFDDWLRQSPKALVLDVREADELRVAALPAPAADAGYELRHIPMNEVPGRLNELDPERPIACLCHHGMRSMRVAQFLAQQGFGQVANITGGIDAWAAQRDPRVPRY